MKNINKYFILPLIVLIIGSCTNLDEKLKGDITNDISIPGIGTVPGGGAADALGAAYAELRNSGSANHSSYYSLQEITSDEMCIAAKGGDWLDGGILIQLHQHTYGSTHDFVRNAWNGSYGAINVCNELLAKGTLDPNQTAQTRALRAFFYGRLLDMYGRVKIVTAPGQTVNAQSTRAELFAFVEQELLGALGVSSIDANTDAKKSPLGVAVNANRINAYGALGILSKLYLNAESYIGTKMYDKAAIAASLVIDSGVYTLCGDGCKVTNLGRRPSVATDPESLEGYAAVFAPNNENNPENVFTIFYDEAKAGGMNFSQMNLHYSSQFTWNFNDQPWNGYATLEDFYNSYEDADVRKKASFIAGPQTDFNGGKILDYASDDNDIQLNYNPKINELQPNAQRESGARGGKFSFKQLGRPDMDNDYPVVRLGDLYLVRGEAKARMSGNWADGLSDINVVRARAKVAPMTSANLNADSFLAERGREMFMESSRRTDLIRYGKYNGTWWQKPVSDPTRNIFPIPQEAINASNGTLTQNPGY